MTNRKGSGKRKVLIMSKLLKAKFRMASASPSHHRKQQYLPKPKRTPRPRRKASLPRRRYPRPKR